MSNSLSATTKRAAQAARRKLYLERIGSTEEEQRELASKLSRERIIREKLIEAKWNEPMPWIYEPISLGNSTLGTTHNSRRVGKVHILTNASHSPSVEN